jgi:hypothetical protein
MERRKSRAVFVRCLLALLACVAASGPQLARRTHARQPQTPAASAPSPAQTPAPRAGRSYDSGAPVKRPASPAPQGESPVTFTDITAQSGVTFRHNASATSRKYLPETMGGGCALFDYDADGRLDIFFTNGAALSDPMTKGASPDKRDVRFWNRLYRQKPDGTFEDVTERAGVRGEGYGMGAAAGDYDNDGWVDLYVTAYGGATLYRNRGDGTFEDVTRKTATLAKGWPTSAGWLDYDRDGRLDLFVARYMDWDFERGSLLCGSAATPAYCHPDNFKGATNILFRQKPDGTFEDVSAKAGVADASGKGLGVAFADFDGDGFTDIFVANDSVRQSLHRNLGDGSFEDVALLAGVGYDENGKTFAGMGVDAADYDNDGQPDVFVTALSNETYPLFRNNGDLTFSYVTSTTGVGQISLLYSGWGTRFVDVDNDGLRDLFVAQGHVLDTIEKTTSYLTYRQPPLLMRNNGKGFVNVSVSAGASLNQPLAARGAAFGDLDNDGDTDIVLGQTDGSALVLRNDAKQGAKKDAAKNHWLGVVLKGAKSNRQGLGARVTLTDASGGRQVFDVNSAGSYLSSSDPRVIVGLGGRTGVRSLEVRWPGGQTQTVSNPEIDKYLTIREK